MAPIDDERVAAIEAAGWAIVKTPYVPDPTGAFGDNEKHAEMRNETITPWRAVKVAPNGAQVHQPGGNLEELLDRCESWEADQARIKPEFRTGAAPMTVGVATTDHLGDHA